MHIQLDTLKIRNFKGIRELEVCLEGKDANIYGTNASGKTTVYDAFLWLLFDKNAEGKKDFGVKPVNEDGKTVGLGLDVSVEAVLYIGTTNCTTVVLKKAYKEKWTRKKGNTSKEFTGHTTEYAIDGLPVNKTKYNEYIDGLIPENTFRLLTDAVYFNQKLSWQDRRKILFDMCGGVDEYEVCHAVPELHQLEDMLANHTADELRKMYKGQRKCLNDQLDMLPNRIDEAYRGIQPELGDLEESKSKIAALEEKRREIEKSMNLTMTDAAKEKERDIREINQKIDTLSAQNRLYRAEAQHTWEENERARRKPKEDMRQNLIAEQVQTEAKRRSEEQYAKEEGALVTALRQMYKDEYERRFDGDTTCPTCGQELPEEKIAQAKMRFAENKKRQLDALAERGKTASNHVKDANDRIRKYNDRLVQIAEELKQCEPELAKERPTIPDMPEYAEKMAVLTDAKAQAEALLAKLRTGADAERAVYEKQMDEVREQIDEENRKILVHEMNEWRIARIAELEHELKQTAENLEEVECKLSLLDNLTRHQVAMTESKINQAFRLTRFRLFNTLINGGIEETCEATVEGVPYPDVNNAMQINCGLDIIRTLGRYYDVQAPIFVDNAESVVQLTDTDCQMVRLVVSEADKVLRVEMADKIQNRAIA